MARADRPLPLRLRVWSPTERRYFHASTVALDGNGHLMCYTPDYDPTRCQWSDAVGPDFHDCVVERASLTAGENGQHGGSL